MGEEEKEERKRKSKSSTLTKEQAELLTCETGILNKLLRLMEDKVLAKAVEKFGSDLQTHFLNPLPYSCPNAPLAETNVLLSVVAINLGKILSSEVLVGILKSKAPSGSRLALVKGLMRGHEKIDQKVEEACVATLMEVHAGRGCEGDEAAKLLVEECLKGKAELVVDWVKGLPGQLVACLSNNKEEEEEEKIVRGKEALALADSCLTLAKASNAELAPVFLDRLSDIKDIAPVDASLLLQRLDWARQHLAKVPVAC